MGSRAAWDRPWIVPVVVFVALAAGMSYAAQHHVRGFERDLRQQVEGELSAVADLWVAQAAEWRRGLLEEATVLVEGSGREREVAALFTGSGSEHDRESLLFSLQRRQRRQKALVASLVDEAGRRVVTTSDERESPPYEREALKRAGRAGRAILVDEPGHPQDLLAVAPVYSERGEFEGGVVLAARVSEALPALVSGRSGPFPGTEVDLGLVEGETVQVVSLAGGDPGAAPNRTVALADAEPIAMAARGEVGISSLRDASGKKVIAARRQVTGSPWVLVTEVREADLLAPATERARSLTVAVGSLLLAAGVALLAWWRGVSAGLARRRRALDERALHLRLEYLWKHANDIVVLSALDGRILDANDRALAAYGYTREELRSLRSSDLRPPELRADHAVLSRLETQGALLFETVHRRKDGSTFPVEVSARLFTLDRQKLIYATARDISDRRRAEQAARLQASLLSRLNDAVVAVDREGRVTAWTGAAERIYGRTAEEVLGQPVAQAFGGVPEDAPHPRPRTDRPTLRNECVHRAKDGTSLDIEMTTVALRDEGGQVVGTLSVNRDVTEQKRAERALRQHQERLQLALEVTEVGICDVDLRSGEAHLSPRLMAMLGRDTPSARIEEILASVHPTDASRFLAQYQDLIAGRIERFEAEYRTLGSGGPVWQRAHARIIERDAAGRATRMVTTVADISAERRLQAQLVFADRLASIGTLAAGVAHEINNPLSYLLANFEFLEERLGERHDGQPDEQALEAVREARDGARRIAEIVRGLRVFSQADRDSAPLAIDIREPVRSAARIAEPQLRGRAQLVLELDRVPPVRCSEHELAQVALNLLVNAGQAMPQANPAGNEIRLATRTAGDGRAVLEVRDSGAGIPAENLPRIFDPFFTTKAVGEGTGLGLSICHGIVESLGGEIEVESTPGQGSVFRVLLPPSVLVPMKSAAPAPLVPLHRGRVLVLDDEPLVCRAVARTLGSEHEVVTLTHPDEALARLAGGEHFDLVLCDLMMPGLTGMQCFEALKASRPELTRNMVFLTGGAFTEEARAFLERVPNRRIEKPFDAEALRALVAEQVGENAA